VKQEKKLAYTARTTAADFPSLQDDLMLAKCSNLDFAQ
jgi:hypothetical protein